MIYSFYFYLFNLHTYVKKNFINTLNYTYLYKEANRMDSPNIETSTTLGLFIGEVSQRLIGISFSNISSIKNIQMVKL